MNLKIKCGNNRWSSKDGKAISKVFLPKDLGLVLGHNQEAPNGMQKWQSFYLFLQLMYPIPKT